MKSILQDWVQELGLRHQGCLISATRGCDGVAKDDASKALIRSLRYEILNPHCGDARKAASYIEKVPREVLKERMKAVSSNFDHYPVHFILHLMHAAQIIGYSDAKNHLQWQGFYRTMCMKMHLNVESREQMEGRLNADEEEFKKAANVEAATPVTACVSSVNRNPNQADPSQPMSKQLPEAFVKGFFDCKNFHVSRASNHYAGERDKSLEQLWDSGWLAANVAVRNGYADPRPRQEGYDAYYDQIPVSNNPYHGIAKGSQEWTLGWLRARDNDRLQNQRAAEVGHICDGNRGHCAQDCPDSEENRAADASSAYVNQDGPGGGFDKSGFYQGHKPTTKELDDMAARNYRGVRS